MPAKQQPNCTVSSELPPRFAQTYEKKHFYDMDGVNPGAGRTWDPLGRRGARGCRWPAELRPGWSWALGNTAGARVGGGRKKWRRKRLVMAAPGLDRQPRRWRSFSCR